MSGIEPLSPYSFNGAYAGFAPLSVFRFHGPDRHEVLNGLLTNEIKSLAPQHGVHACLLSSQGKLKAHLFLQNRGEDLLGLCPRENFSILKGTLNKYLMVSESVLEEIPDWKCLAAFLPGAVSPPLEEMGLAFPIDKEFLGKSCLLLPGQGDSLTETLDILMSKGVNLLKFSDLETWRVEAGFPRLGTDVDDTVFPVEANLQSAVHPNKGCYLGQEVIARLSNKGQPRRQLVRLKLPSEQKLGSLVCWGEQVVGHLTSQVHSSRYHTWLGLALLFSEACDPVNKILIREHNILTPVEIFEG
ncbi:MAG: hypothetical protein JNK54_03320 [Elusimicrobia bacterium]|nr:hypothetical protein [Elusimicrobiota bacterium]